MQKTERKQNFWQYSQLISQRYPIPSFGCAGPDNEIPGMCTFLLWSNKWKKIQKCIYLIIETMTGTVFTQEKSINNRTSSTITFSSFFSLRYSSFPFFSEDSSRGKRLRCSTCPPLWLLSSSVLSSDGRPARAFLLRYSVRACRNKHYYLLCSLNLFQIHIIQSIHKHQLSIRDATIHFFLTSISGSRFCLDQTYYLYITEQTIKRKNNSEKSFFLFSNK